MINIKDNYELYSFKDLETIKKSIDFSLSLPSSYNNEPVTFHFYWRVPKDFGRKQQLPLKATLVTQQKRKTNIILWSNIDLRDNYYFKPLSNFVENRIWSLFDEVKDTPLESSTILKGPTDDNLCWLGGDLFRLLTLYKYGGVYLDMDTVPLRDFDPLLDYEFMYQWGSSGTTVYEPDIMINGAVMRLLSKSRLAEDLLNELKNTPGVPNSNSWERDLYGKVVKFNKDLVILPCSWFDTDWALDNKKRPRGPFNNIYFLQKKDLFIDGPFAWHWHNQWDAKIGNRSKFAIIEKIIDKKFDLIVNRLTQNNF